MLRTSLKSPRPAASVPRLAFSGCGTTRLISAAYYRSQNLRSTEKEALQWGVQRASDSTRRTRRTEETKGKSENSPNERVATGTVRRPRHRDDGRKDRHEIFRVLEAATRQTSGKGSDTAGDPGEEVGAKENRRRAGRGKEEGHTKGHGERPEEGRQFPREKVGDGQKRGTGVQMREERGRKDEVSRECCTWTSS